MRDRCAWESGQGCGPVPAGTPAGFVSRRGRRGRPPPRIGQDGPRFEFDVALDAWRQHRSLTAPNARYRMSLRGRTHMSVGALYSRFKGSPLLFVSGILLSASINLLTTLVPVKNLIGTSEGIA